MMMIYIKFNTHLRDSLCWIFGGQSFIEAAVVFKASWKSLVVSSSGDDGVSMLVVLISGLEAVCIVLEAISIFFDSTNC